MNSSNFGGFDFDVVALPSRKAVVLVAAVAVLVSAGVASAATGGDSPAHSTAVTATSDEPKAPDADNDGVSDENDFAPNDPAVFTREQTIPDTDGDGVKDPDDFRPNDAAIQTADQVPANPADYAALSAREWALIAKDPASATGRKVVVYATVAQFDAATGSVGFRGYAAASPQEYWYSDGVNTYFYGDESDLAPVVEDDVVKVYVTVLGPLSYDTQAGGSTTVPALTVDIIKVIG